MEKYQNAIDNYSKAIEIKPDFSQAIINRGIAYMKLSKYKLAISDFGDYIKKSNSNEDIAKGLTSRAMAYLSLDDRDFISAIRDFSDALKLIPTSEQIILALANTCYSYAYTLAEKKAPKKDVQKYLNLAIKLVPSMKDKIMQEEIFKDYL